VIPAETAQRLAKLVRLLASDQDGEVISTVRAIGRTLAAASLDFHALAAVIEEAATRPRIVPTQFPPDEPDLGDVDFGHMAWDSADLMREAFEAAERRRREARDAPDAPATRHGLPIWGTQKIAHWGDVVEHCLMLDWTIPKAAGGKFLSREDRDRLKSFRCVLKRRPTNADAEWIEGVLTRCHEVRDAWRARKAA